MLYQSLVRNTFEALLNPFAIILILLSITLCLCLTCHELSIRIYSAIPLIVCIFAFSTGWLPNALLHHLIQQYPMITKPQPDIPWIVVLGGGHKTYARGIPVNQMLMNASTNRFLEGIRLYQAAPKSKLILSGGGYHLSKKKFGHLKPNIPKDTDGFEMAQLASWFHIPKKDIIIESKSINTADQAQAIKALVGGDPFYLVTSAIHMPRSMALFHKQGLHPIAAPAEYFIYAQDHNTWVDQIKPDPWNLVKMNFLCHEYLGLLWEKIRGQA